MNHLARKNRCEWRVPAIPYYIEPHSTDFPSAATKPRRYHSCREPATQVTGSIMRSDDGSTTTKLAIPLGGCGLVVCSLLFISCTAVLGITALGATVDDSTPNKADSSNTGFSAGLAAETAATTPPVAKQPSDDPPAAPQTAYVDTAPATASVDGTSTPSTQNTARADQEPTATTVAPTEATTTEPPATTAAPTTTVIEPAADPPRTTAAPPQPRACNYDPCLPPAEDYDCVGGKGNGPAYTGQVRVIGADTYGLDSDGDGIGCEGK